MERPERDNRPCRSTGAAPCLPPIGARPTCLAHSMTHFSYTRQSSKIEESGVELQEKKLIHTKIYTLGNPLTSAPQAQLINDPTFLSNSLVTLILATFLD